MRPVRESAHQHIANKIDMQTTIRVWWREGNAKQLVNGAKAEAELLGGRGM